MSLRGIRCCFNYSRWWSIARVRLHEIKYTCTICAVYATYVWFMVRGKISRPNGRHDNIMFTLEFLLSAAICKIKSTCGYIATFILKWLCPYGSMKSILHILFLTCYRFFSPNGLLKMVYNSVGCTGHSS